MKKEAWECALGEGVHSTYFAPPTDGRGTPTLVLTAYHRDYPTGRVFARSELGEPWYRTT